jgi:hypothetical protein
MAVHSGDAEPTDGDYFGTTVTRTARLIEQGTFNALRQDH